MERFRADTLDAAVQALHYARSAGVSHKSAKITDNGSGPVTVEADFGNIDPKLLNQIQHYTEGQGITWGTSKKT